MSTPGEWGGFSDSLGFQPKYVEPFGHIECLLATHKGIGYLNNYEANTDHFPLQYKETEQYTAKELPADYAIIWRTEYGDVAGLEEEYELIDSNDYNRLYRRKRAVPETPKCGVVKTTVALLTCNPTIDRQHPDTSLSMQIQSIRMGDTAG